MLHVQHQALCMRRVLPVCVLMVDNPAGAHLQASKEGSNWLLVCGRLPGLLQPCLAITAGFPMKQLQNTSKTVSIHCDQCAWVAVQVFSKTLYCSTQLHLQLQTDFACRWPLRPSSGTLTSCSLSLIQVKHAVSIVHAAAACMQPTATSAW
jgi:hypothetical protein